MRRITLTLLGSAFLLVALILCTVETPYSAGALSSAASPDWTLGRP